MNFLYVSESPHPMLGGAAKCVYTLFSYLAKMGHLCYTLGQDTVDTSFDFNGVTCIRTTNLREALLTVFQEWNIDIVVTQLQGADWVVDLCTSVHKPVVLRIPSLEFVCLDQSYMQVCGIHCLKGKPCVAKGKYFSMFGKVKVVMACSEFASKIVQGFYNIHCFTVYPFVDPNEHLVDQSGERITMVSGIIPKGIEPFAEIARALPSYKYLIAGDLDVGIDLSGIDLFYAGSVEDMRLVWNQTKILLIPSLVQEAFGRVAIEAALNGIPVVASDRGGLPEAVGPMFCYSPLKSDDWVREIKALMEDPVYYGIRSIQVREFAKKFNLKEQVADFLQLVYKIRYPDLPTVTKGSKISVLTSSYRSVPYLENYFRNLLSQTYCNFEIILTLNDPTSGEEQIIEKYISYFDITVLRVPLESVAETLNRSFQMASGDIVVLAAVDDTLREDAFQRYVASFNVHSDIDVVYGDHVRMDTRGNVVAKGPVFDFSIGRLKELFFLGPHPVFRRRVIENGELLNTDYLYACDYEFYMRLATKGYKFLHIPIVLSEYLEHPEAITYTYRQEQIRDTERVQALYR